MDGDSRQYRHHDHSQFPSTLGMGRRAAPTLSVGTTDRLRQAGTLPSARGEAALLSQAPGRAPIPSYVDYGYTDTSFQGISLQQGATQLQSYPPPQFQSRLPPAAQPAHPSPQRPQQQEQQQQQPPFNPYGREVVYNFQQQQGPAHGPYGAVSPYPPRQSAAAIDALSGQFAVPQYFPAGEPTGSAVAGMVPPYMNSHLPPSAAYNHPGLMGRSSATAQPFPANMADLTTPLETAQQQQQPSPQQPQQPLQHQQPQPVAAESASTTASNLSEAYGQFQRALRRILDHSRAGRLVQASRSLLETSEWLVTNARELGILRDDQSLHPDQLRLWNDFNICWLSVFQMQKDLTQSLLQTGHQQPHVSLLSAGSMEQIGKELIQLCDQLEQHGLVDYQMGVWEEEILSVLSQCLDMMESRQEMLNVHPMTATVTNTSRS